VRPKIESASVFSRVDPPSRSISRPLVRGFAVSGAAGAAVACGLLQTGGIGDGPAALVPDCWQYGN
jgi:hypothetical protein